MRKLICFFGNLWYSSFPKKKLDQKADKDIKRILVFKIGALGDVLMTTPFLRILRKRFPCAKITYLTGEFCRPVLEGNKNIDRLETFDHNIFYKKNLSGVFKLVKRIKKEEYDCVFVLDKHFFVNWVISLTKIPIRIGFNRCGEGFANTVNVPYNKVKHEIDYYLELAYAAGAKKVNSAAEKHLEITIPAKDSAFAKKFIKKNKLNTSKLICLVPGGASNPGQNMSTRRWPVDNFRQLADNLIEKKFSVLLVGGPGDREFSKNFNRTVVSAVGKTTLKQSIALIKLCKAAVVSDSGPMHFASAVNTPTVSIFGVTDPRRKAPLSTKCAKHAYIWKMPALKSWNDDGIFHDFDKVKTIDEVHSADVFDKLMKLLKK